MIDPHPLAPFLDVEGLALSRAFAGEHDETFSRARIEEARQVLESGQLFANRVDPDQGRGRSAA